eukprot:5028335-Amphidinium_carterae.2
MLSQITPARLENYHDFIKRKQQHYKTTSWPLLYQGDVRARTEKVEGCGVKVPSNMQKRTREMSHILPAVPVGVGLCIATSSQTSSGKNG